MSTLAHRHEYHIWNYLYRIVLYVALHASCIQQSYIYHWMFEYVDHRHTSTETVKAKLLSHSRRLWNIFRAYCTTAISSFSPQQEWKTSPWYRLELNSVMIIFLFHKNIFIKIVIVKTKWTPLIHYITSQSQHQWQDAHPLPPPTINQCRCGL